MNSDVNEGVSYINFIDHGGPTGWYKNYGMTKVYGNANVAATSNGNQKPVVVAMACLTIWFDDPSGCQFENFAECLGEAWTENKEDEEDI